MSRSRLSMQFTYGNWSKFCKNYKKRYKEETGKDLAEDVATAVTFGKLMKKVPKYKQVEKEDGTFDTKLVIENAARLPDLDDLIPLVICGNNYCTEEEAMLIYKNYADAEENKDVGIIGALLDIICDLYGDLNLITGAYKRACLIRDNYREKLKEEDKKEENTEVVETKADENKEDTQE